MPNENEIIKTRLYIAIDFLCGFFEGQENNNDILINLKVRRNMPSLIFVPKILIF